MARCRWRREKKLSGGIWSGCLHAGRRSRSRFISLPWVMTAVNVIFTLVAGVVFAALSYRAKLWQMYALYVLALVSMLWVLPVEFGLAGMMLPSAIVLVQRGHKSAWPFLILLVFFINAGGMLVGIRAHAGAEAWTFVALNGLFSSILPWLVVDMARRLPQKGRFLPKYALHVFYPAHLVILKLLGMVFFK